jgi:hypothetical protein
LHKEYSAKCRNVSTKTPSLYQESDKFFEQSANKINYKFIHDELHDLMAHKELPMYTYMQPENTTSAWCDKNKWDNFTFDEKCWTVLEEGYVISLERILIPEYFNNNIIVRRTPDQALQWSLMRIGTNLCSGWFRAFANENYSEIWKRKSKYFDKFLKAYTEEKIKPSDGKLVK